VVEVTGYTSFLGLAKLFEDLESTTKRNEKKTLISSFLKRLEEEEIQPATSFLIGRVFPETDPRILEVGGRTIWSIMKDVKQTTLVQKRSSILTVSRYFNEISKTKGKRSRQKKHNLVRSLLNQATTLERKYLIRILMGEMRIGVVEGVTMEAIADAASVDLQLVRRGNMLLGNLGEVARLALIHGAEGLKKVNISLFTPIKPMLAETSYDLKEVLDKHGGLTGFEYKLDGARVQIHIKEGQVKIFSRRLTDVTRSIPEIVEVVNKQIVAEEALLEGEVVAYGDNGKPLPFQALMRRFRRIHQIDSMIKEIPLRLYLFDILYLNGVLLIDKPNKERWKILSSVGKPLQVKRIVTNKVSEAQDFLGLALKHGHEGVMAKDLKSSYLPGKRGKKWFKVKPVETLDLIIIAADWGTGRRVGWLSNYHLAVINEETGKYLNVGKTFKGLTDDEFKEMTNRLLKIKTKENGYTVYVKPKIVVEVGFNEIQRSPHYESGFALRFARITRIRDDKEPKNADTINRIKKLYEKQFKFKAKFKLKE
jgi:DNA ligase-1